MLSWIPCNIHLKNVKHYHPCITPDLPAYSTIDSANGQSQESYYFPSEFMTQITIDNGQNMANKEDEDGWK
jgi:hypothetical protein